MKKPKEEEGGIKNKPRVYDAEELSSMSHDFVKGLLSATKINLLIGLQAGNLPFCLAAPQ